MTATTERTIMRRERQAALDELLYIGSQMSNFCFNLKQRGPADACGTYPVTAKDLQEKWDAARTRYRQATEKR